MSKTNKALQITPVDTLKEYGGGEIVEFPPFAEGKPFFAKVKRPSMMILMRDGRIPNHLIGTANSVFAGTNKQGAEENQNYFKDMLEVIEVIAEASFVEPSYRDLKENGVELTDEQMLFLFQYTQKGVKALESFRK